MDFFHSGYHGWSSNFTRGIGVIGWTLLQLRIHSRNKNGLILVQLSSANMTTEEQKIIAQGRRYVEAQQAKIETQRVLIRDLENAGRDPGIIALEKGLWAKWSNR
jgi:hypothetical protein